MVTISVLLLEGTCSAFLQFFIKVASFLHTCPEIWIQISLVLLKDRTFRLIVAQCTIGHVIHLIKNEMSALQLNCSDGQHLAPRKLAVASDGHSPSTTKAESYFSLLCNSIGSGEHLHYCLVFNPLFTNRSFSRNVSVCNVAMLHR